MGRSILDAIFSSSPNAVCYRFLVIFAARYACWRIPSREATLANLSTTTWLLVLALGTALVTGCPFRQIYNLIRNTVAHGSRHRAPGPLLAKASRVWKIWQVCRGDFNVTIRELHRKHGSVVQITPEEYSFSDPAVIDQVYRGTGFAWRKADWYSVAGPPQAEARALFNNRDFSAHSKIRRNLAPSYRKEEISQLEALLEGPLKELEYVLDGVSKMDGSIDLARTLKLFAFDATGAVTKGTSFGALRGNHGPPMVLGALEISLKYVALVGNVPEWHPFFWGLMQFPGVPNMIPFIEEFIESNIDTRLKDGGKGKTEDMLSRFLPSALSLSDPVQIHEALRQMVETNALASADTTSTTMCAAIHYLVMNESALQRLRAELTGVDEGDRKHAHATQVRTSSTAYLEAVIKEAMRLHPAVGMTLPRVVPREGAVIAGNHFVGSQIVGTNAWLMHHDESVWGPDHDNFKPERWLTDDQAAISGMNRAFFAFGAGARECIGKHIAMIIAQRLLALVVTRYDLMIAAEDVSWRCMQFTQFSKMLAHVRRLDAKQ